MIKKLNKEGKSDSQLKNREAPEDLGFRVLELAESNFRQWSGVEERDGDRYADQMDLFVDPLLPGWTAEGAIWEVAIKEGYSLSSKIGVIAETGANRVWRVTDVEREQYFLICLDESLEDITVKDLPLAKDDLFVCRDVALTDEQAANLALMCRLKTI